MKAVRQLSPIHCMAPLLRTYGSYQGRECSTRPCHGSGYAHSALEHSQLTYGDAIGMSGMQLLRCWYCTISGSCPTPPELLRWYGKLQWTIAARSFAQSALRHHFLLPERWLVRICCWLPGESSYALVLTRLRAFLRTTVS